jgi:hypothetical protein
MGKWSGLKDKYPRYAEGDPGFLERVQAARAAHAADPFPELIARFAKVRAEKDELKERTQELNVALEALGQLLLEQFETHDLTSVRTNEGKLLYGQVEPHVAVTDREQLETYLDAHADLQYLYRVNWQGLNVLVKELLEQGRDAEVPPGTGIFLKSGIRIRK